MNLYVKIILIQLNQYYLIFFPVFDDSVGPHVYRIYLLEPSIPKTEAEKIITQNLQNSYKGMYQIVHVTTLLDLQASASCMSVYEIYYFIEYVVTS